MSIARLRPVAAAMVLGAALAACSPGAGAASIAGAGASSQENASLAWIAGFADAADEPVTVTYDPLGSGTGREKFLSGSVDFAGSDSALDAEERALAARRCHGGEALELPLYISPIALVYNLDIDAPHLSLTPETIAGIFMGEITRWDAPQIAASNPGTDLPALDIIPVNRSDKSGTTGNFTEYLSAVAPDVWTHGKVEEWPIPGTQSGQQTSGMVDVVASAEGAIGYADASRAGDLGTVAVGVGKEFVPYSAGAAAAVVDASPPTDDASDLRLTVDLARDVEGAYPIVLISYLLACSTYDDDARARHVADFLTYVASEEGQARAAQPDVAGSAPISPALRERVMDAISAIGVAE